MKCLKSKLYSHGTQSIQQWVDYWEIPIPHRTCRGYSSLRIPRSCCEHYQKHKTILLKSTTRLLKSHCWGVYCFMFWGVLFYVFLRSIVLYIKQYASKVLSSIVLCEEYCFTEHAPHSSAWASGCVVDMWAQPEIYNISHKWAWEPQISGCKMRYVQLCCEHWQKYTIFLRSELYSHCIRSIQ